MGQAHGSWPIWSYPSTFPEPLDALVNELLVDLGGLVDWGAVGVVRKPTSVASWHREFELVGASHRDATGLATTAKAAAKSQLRRLQCALIGGITNTILTARVGRDDERAPEVKRSV